MRKLMERWRNFQQLHEDRAKLRFKNFTGLIDKEGGEEVKVTDRPEDFVEVIRNSTQWKRFKKKLSNDYHRKIKKAIVDNGGTEKQAEEYLKTDKFEDGLEEFMESMLAASRKGSRGLTFPEASGEIKAISKSPKMLRKLQKDYFLKAKNFLKEMIEKMGADTTHDEFATKHHEALHYHFEQIKKAYGEKIYQILLNQLMNIFGKGKENSAYDLISKYLLNIESYDIKKEEVYEEVLAFARQFLVEKRKRAEFKKFIEKKGEVPREAMNKIKSALKEATQFAQNVKPEHIQ